jgi:hypothetical protein
VAYAKKSAGPLSDSPHTVQRTKLSAPLSATEPNQKNKMNNSIEITKEAAWALIGNDEHTWHNYENHELYEMSEYRAHGVRIQAIFNYLSNVTQYYIQDINA